jgi:hypothetical protein
MWSLPCTSPEAMETMESLTRCPAPRRRPPLHGLAAQRLWRACGRPGFGPIEQGLACGGLPRKCAAAALLAGMWGGDRAAGGPGSGNGAFRGGSGGRDRSRLEPKIGHGGVDPERLQQHDGHGSAAAPGRLGGCMRVRRSSSPSPVCGSAAACRQAWRWLREGRLSGGCVRDGVGIRLGDPLFFVVVFIYFLCCLTFLTGLIGGL